MSWTIDEDGLVECDCGVVGFAAIVNEQGAVCSLECVSCGETYDTTTDEFKAAAKRAAEAYNKMHKVEEER